ncbi:MAG: U32 family peptidase [Acidobacteria bacterium]|nr:U32 family peptidase [Acidobacteriota bacterium]
MANKYFSMPADFKNNTIDRYDELNHRYENARVIETYGNVTVSNALESGRVLSQLPQVDLTDLEMYIGYAREKGIEFNYTLNGTHLHNREFKREGVKKIKEFLRDIYSAGVRHVTVSLPTLMEIIQSLPYDFKIKASTLCQVTTPNKAAAYKQKGIDRLVVDESVNRNFAVLKKIARAFGPKVEIIINPLCLKDCIYRVFHYNQISSDSIQQDNDIGVNYYEHRCVMQRHTNLSNLLRMCWVRPEDLSFYLDSGINHFKIQGRQAVLKGDPVKAVEAYFRESYDGDLMDLLYIFYPLNSFRIFMDNKKLDGFIKPFFQEENFCGRDCAYCGYCDRFAEKVIDYGKAAAIKNLADKFYFEYDKFTGMIQEEEPGANTGTGSDLEMDVDIDVDFNI